MREKLAVPPTGEYIVFDLETTGFCTPGDGIVEIAAVKCDGDGNVLGRFEELANPGCPIKYKSMLVHGITEGMVAGCPAIGEVLGRFLAFAGNLPLVGHNICSFDMRFLDQACQDNGRPLMGNSVFDTLPFARRILGSTVPCGVEALVERFGLEKLRAHRAMPDVLMENSVFLALREEYKAWQANLRKAGTPPKAVAKTRQAEERYLCVYPGEGVSVIEIKGYVPMKDVVDAYDFLRWERQEDGRWRIKMAGAISERLPVLEAEMAARGCRVMLCNARGGL